MTQSSWSLGDGTEVADADEARDALHRLLDAGRRDITLRRSSDLSVQLVSNGTRAMLVLWGREGADEGVHAVDEAAPSDPIGGFTLENGQVDAYPARETVPLGSAIEAVVHAIKTGSPDPRLSWQAW